MPLDPSVLSPGLEDAAPRKKRASLDLDSYLEAEGASHLKPVVEAIYGQESGSGRTNATSVDGARGGMQVIPATFNRLARDGERIDNPDDNMRVGIRYIKQLGDRFGNDPARIAAGYFSGEGNVATSGDTPYKADRADGNGKRVSSYAQDVLGRIGNSVIPSAQAEEAKSRPASMGNRLDQLESLRDGGTRPSDRLSQLSSLQDAPQEDASASKPNDTSLLDPIKKWWNGPGSVMDGYQTDPQEASRNVIGMTKVGEAKLREQLNGMPDTKLAKYVDQGGLIGQVAGQMLEQRKGYADSLQQGNVPTMLEEAQATGKVRPPTAEEQAAAPISPAQTLDDIKASIASAPQEMVGTLASLVQGDIKKDSWLERQIQEARKLTKSNASGEDANAVYPYTFGLTRARLRNLGQQATYSVAAMGAGLAAGAAAAATGVGLPGAVPAAMAGAGVAAYRMDTNNFLHDIRDMLDTVVKKNRGTPLTDDEFVKIAKSYAPLVREHGFAEALPEAVGQVVGMGVNAYIFKNAIKGGLAAIGRSVGAKAFDTGVELGTEGLTQQFQHNTEIDAGTGTGDKRSLTSLDDWKQSLSEVAPEVLLTTGGMGAASHIGGKAYSAAEAKIAPGRVLGREMQEQVDQMGYSQEGVDAEARRNLSPDFVRGAVTPEETRKPAGVLPSVAPVQTDTQPPPDDPLAAPPVSNPIANELAGFNNPEAAPGQSAPQQVQGAENGQGQETEVLIGGRPAREHTPASLSFLMNAHPDQTTRDLAASALAQKQAESRDADPELEDTVRRITGDANASLVSGDTLHSTRGGGSQDAVVRAILDLSGKEPVWYRANGADGFALPQGQPNRVFLNADKADIAPVVTAGHEVFHLVEKEAPDLRDAFRATVDRVSKIDLSTDDGLLAYAQTYAPKQLAEGGGTIDGLLSKLGSGYTRDTLRNEFYNDVFGNRWHEPGFYKALIKELARTDIGLLGKFKAALDLVAQKVSSLRGQNFEADKFLSDIEPVRQEAARVYAAYASRQSHRDRLSKMTPAELLMTSKSHPDEVVRDMADAEVKRREVEAAYQQHARQQPAMAAKEQKEKRQQSGQTFREQEAAKEAEADQKVAQAVRESEQEESRVTALEQALAGAKKDNQALRRQVAKEMKKAAATARGAAQVRQDVLADNEQGQFSPARDDGQTLPTRWPTAAKATPSINDPMLADLATLRETETQFAQAVEALASEPGMRSRAKTLDGKLRFVLDRMVDNLLWLHDQVPADIRTRSKLWYDGANAIANRWADQYDKSKAQAAGILAVLSPQKDWFMNVTMGERVLDVMSTQMDHAFDAKMRGAAFKFLTKEWTKAPEDRKNMAAFQSIKDKTLREAIAGGDLRAAGIWLRAYDEAHHDPRHAVIHPEGDFGENARTATDTETLRAWGDFTTLGKAASIFLDGSPENINDKLGAEHKVRNFYNNIFAPKDERFATIDTHAVAADLLRPLAGADKPVADNFGKTGGSKLTGVSGTYPIHLEAYKRAAEARGILPREMQSITWEAVRGLFTEGFKGKKQNLTAISNVWTDVDKGVLTADQAREKILGMAGGIQHPDWWEGQAAGVIGNAKSYAQSRPVFSGNKIIFEVAPDPHNEELTRRWNAMPEDKKAAISFDIAWDTAGKLLGFYNTEHIKGELHTQVGGYLDNTNPSFSLWMNKYTSMVKVQEIAHALGYALNQDSMVIGSPKSFRGGTEMGAVTIQGVSDTNAKAVYDELRAAIRGDNGEALIEGHTTAEGSMVILVPKGTEEAIHHRIVDQLGDRHDVGYGTTFVQWPEKGDNDYGFIGQDKTGGGSTEPSLREYVHQLRDEASAELDRRISAVGFSPDRSDAARDGRAGAGTEGQPGQDIPGYGVATPGSVRVRGVHYSSGERSSLDGRYYGTGARGAEGPRVRAAEDSRIKERIYFYVDSGKGITPEQGVGSIAHAAQLNNLYDLNADTWLQKKLPQGLTGDAVQNAFESAVIDNGFDGYVADFGTQRAAVLLGRHSVPVTRSTDQASVEAPSQGKPARRTDLPMGKMSGAEWKKLEPRATELEDDKSYYRDEVKYSPERFDKIAEAFADRARKALANPRNTQPVLIHSNTPASMQILGWADRKLMVEASELAKIANKPGFETDEKIGNLVLDLARPGAMFWNDKQGSLNILRREDMRGAPALIAVRPGVPMGIDRAHLMVTAHRLENQGALLRKITSGELKPLYLDQANPLIKQAMQTRKYRASTLDLLAPENLHARASVQLDTSSRLLSEADLVKWEQDNWGDAPKFSPARAQTETPEFKKWYEGSNLRNADGSPMVLYHGTNKDFSRFGISKTGAMGPGVYLGDDPEVANAYAGGNGANVMPVYARGRYIGNREWSSYVGENGWEKGREKAIKDGVAGVWDQKFESAVLVFDPSNIKSAIGNNGQFDRTNPDIRYSPSRWYFSPLQRAFEQAPDRVFSTAPQIKAWLSSNASKLGVKQDEIQWSGINDWLDLQGKQKVSKDQVIQYLANNGVQVEEVEKDKGGYDEENPTLPEGRDLKVIEADEEYHGRMASRYKYVVIDEAADTTKGWGNSEEDAIADAHSGHPEYWEGNDATQYSQYVLPGGKNYRELLLTLPEKEPDNLNAIAQRMFGKRFSDLEDDDANAVTRAEREQKQSENYSSPHWSEKNILAHVRMNDRTDAEGNRVLFIEELQSDWGQAGKKTGFGKPSRTTIPLAPGEYQAFMARMKEAASKELERRTEGKVEPEIIKGVIDSQPLSQVAEWAGLTAEFDALSQRNLDDATPSKNTVIPTAPFVTDTKAWVSLAVKRMIAYAVENGYDKVAFVNGEQSADRYDLSKKIESIGYDPKVKRLEAYDKNRSQVIDKTVSEDQLEDYIGKEVAKRLLEQPLVMGKHLLDGEEIKVGGEGMKAFYDKIVPQTVSDVLKKVGGGKLESVRVGVGSVAKTSDRLGFDTSEIQFKRDAAGNWGVEKNPDTVVGGKRLYWDGSSFVEDEGSARVFGSKEEATASVTASRQTGFSITPAMREQVSRGLPLFSLARKVSDAVDSTLGKLDAAVDGLSNLPDQFDYLRDRYLALGKVARVDEIINEIRDGFKDVPQADKAAVYAYLTTRGASPSMIGHAEARAMAKRIKDTINYVGDALVARGLLDPAARAHYKDQYLPRMYLKHLMSEQDWKVLGAGKKPTDMGYLKHRKDIAPEIRELVLGEVKDPAFLSASAIGRAMRDVALLDWLGKISQNDNWIYPSVFVPYRGQRVSAFWLKSEADRISRQIPHYEAAAQAKAQQLVDQMRSLADAAIHALPAIQNGAVVIEHTKYKQIPDTNRYGLLRGMLVREEVYNDIMGDSQLVNADPGVFADWLGYGGKGTKLVQAWKFAKVALNPPGQIRNFMSNMVMLQLSGIGLHKLPVLLVQAANEISKNGRHWMIAKKYGVTESTFTAQELHRFKRDLLALEVQAKGMHPLSWLRLAGTHLFDKVGDLYQFTEALGKTIKIIDEMNKGKSEAEAAIEAQKWLFDYSLVNKEIRYLRNAPVGAPFLTYQAKVLPRLLEVATKHPWRFLPWAGLLYGMQAYVASLFGADDDDLKKLKKSLPQWLQDRGHTVFLPFRDADGRLQVADVGYYFPWTFYSQTGGHLWEGNLKKALVDDIFGMMSSPILGAAGALATNYDSFTKRPIYNEADPGSYQAAAIANYAYDLMAPPFVSSHGFASPMGLVDKQYGGKMVQAVSGTTNKFGDPKATEGQALAGLLGFNFYGLDPEHTRATNLQVMTAKVQEAERQLKYRLMDRGLSDEQRGKYVADYQRRMIELGQEAKKYANESEVPEQLRASRPSP